LQSEYNRAAGDLTAHKAELRHLRTTLEQLETGNAEAFTVSKTDVERAVEAHPDVQRLRAELLETERHRDEVAEKAARPGLEIVRKARVAVQEKQKELERKKVQVRGSAADLLKEEKRASASSTIETTKQRIRHLEHMQKLLEKECDWLARVQASFNKEKIDLEEFRPELHEAEQMVSTLGHRAEVMAVEAEAPPRVTRMQEETIVRRPNEQMRKVRFSAMAVLAALALAVFGVGFTEYRTRRLTSAADVTRHVGLNVIGALPFCRGKSAHNRTAQQQLKEAVDSARTLLLHASGSEGIKVVQVVSSVSGEGKTSLACHLASSLARAGRQTLLLDADLRKPNVHSVFGMEQGPGISEVLRGEFATEAVIQETRLPGLHVICAGRLDDRALCAVAQTGLASLLTQLRERYDFVIVDSSPVLPVPDALMMAQHTDGVLFAVMEDVTRLHHLASAVERMNRVGSQLLGAVVNGSREAEHQTYGQYARYLKAGQS
jgi:capsular exopolysaccharide synthesis family protein